MRSRKSRAGLRRTTSEPGRMDCWSSAREPPVRKRTWAIHSAASRSRRPPVALLQVGLQEEDGVAVALAPGAQLAALVLDEGVRSRVSRSRQRRPRRAGRRRPRPPPGSGDVEQRGADGVVLVARRWRTPRGCGRSSPRTRFSPRAAWAGPGQLARPGPRRPRACSRSRGPVRVRGQLAAAVARPGPPARGPGARFSSAELLEERRPRAGPSRRPAGGRWRVRPRPVEGLDPGPCVPHGTLGLARGGPRVRRAGKPGGARRPPRACAAAAREWRERSLPGVLRPGGRGLAARRGLPRTTPG